MAFQEKLLGQARPGSTTAATLYSRPASTTVIIKTIVVANTTAAPETFRIFHDDDGTTYDQSNALFYDVAIAANTTTQVDIFMAMATASGTIGVRTSTASALTFTAYGVEIT